jgi:hypothetical protein
MTRASTFTLHFYSGRPIYDFDLHIRNMCAKDQTVSCLNGRIYLVQVPFFPTELTSVITTEAVKMKSDEFAICVACTYVPNKRLFDR